MSRRISTGTELVSLYASLTGYKPASDATAIFEFDNGIPIAGMAYDNYFGYSITNHVWVAQGRRPSRVWWWVVHDYPINQVGVQKVFGVVRSSNKAAQRLVSSAGYKLVGRVPDFYADGEDCLFYEVTADTAVFWQRYGGAEPPKYGSRGEMRMPT
jgi:hypothetical protein